MLIISFMQREADESAHAAEQARAEAAELLNRLHAKDVAMASAEAARDDALCQARSAETGRSGPRLCMHDGFDLLPCPKRGGLPLIQWKVAGR